ncbi:MAG: outer membrane lipoprotein carrier protein LolA [Gammaproteobacteria bacterium]|nr:outer membrane lipoprotein carrier protein LolA [Gammaproteobacteria bacterium]
MKLFPGAKILKIVKYFQLILFLLCFQPAVAESLDQQKTAERFIENIKGIKSYQADFEQKVHNEMGAEVDYSSGKFYIQNTNHFRWEVEEVFPQLIIGNGKYIYTYDPELEQVTIQKSGTNAGRFTLVAADQYRREIIGVLPCHYPDRSKEKRPVVI